MEKIPVFFESKTSKEGEVLSIVGRLRAKMFESKFYLMPFATNPSELNRVLHAMKLKGQSPLLFVINTHGAEDLLPELDMLIGKTPILLFRRELVWLKGSGKNYEGPGLTTRIDRMSARLTAIWFYGSVNYQDVAARAANLILRYREDEDFTSLERSGDIQRLINARI